MVAGSATRYYSAVNPVRESNVHNRTWLAIPALILMACSSGARSSMAQAPVSPQAGAEAAVQGFLQAVADSDLVKMAQHWGTSKGPAASTHEPADYEKRIIVMQAYLRNLPYRILSNTQDGENRDRRVLQVEFTRNGCEAIAPFTTVKVDDRRWVVNALDLAKVGGPGSQCGQAPAGSGQTGT